MGSSMVKMIRGALGWATEVRILVVGLDASGKTTLIYKMNPVDVQEIVPTIGMHAQFLNCKGAQFTALDIGAPDTNYHFMRHFFENANAMIFCVDSSDRDRIPNARTELQKMLRYYDERTVPVLVFANKQDSSYALPIDEFIREMGLEEIKNQPWYVQPSRFTEREGIYEGMDWLSRTVAITLGEDSAFADRLR